MFVDTCPESIIGPDSNTVWSRVMVGAPKVRVVKLRSVRINTKNFAKIFESTYVFW